MTPHPPQIEATQLHHGWLGRLNFGVVAGVLVTVLVAAGCAGGSEAVAPASVDSATATTTATVEAPTTATVVAETTTTNAPPATLPPTSLPPTTLDVAGEPMIEFSIDVGEGVDLERSELVGFVIETLTDPRGWRSRGAGFRLVESGGSFTLLVATPDRVDEICAPLRTNGYFSCARNGFVALNADRWFNAIDDWPSDLATYRRYVVNHEIGHYILGPNHPGCPGDGLPAPIMMQQTKGLNGCTANGWVDAVDDAEAE